MVFHVGFWVADARRKNRAPDSREVVKGFPVVLEYAERIHDRYFPDYEKWAV